MTDNRRKIWKIRTVKNYPQAQNHIIIGKVIEIHDSWISLKCRTYHFGTRASSLLAIRVGTIMNRIIPWSRIEIINELPIDFDYTQAELKLNNKSEILLSDGNYSQPLITSQESGY